MKKLSLLIILSPLLFISCSKQSSPASPVPPVVDSTGSNSNKLPKTLFTSFQTGGSNLDSFAYDNLKRVTYYSQYDVSPTNTGTSINILNEYQFSYTGNNTFPSNYTFTQSMINQTGPSSSVTMRDTLIYNAGGQLVTDSTVYTTLPPLYSINKIKTYTYAGNLVVARAYYPNNTAYNLLDSNFLDNNGNEVQHIQGGFDKNNNYTRGSISSITFGSILNPFKTNSSGTAMFTVYGIIAGKNLETSRNTTRYNANATTTTETSNSQWTTNSSGLVQKLNHTGNISFLNLTTVYTYY